MTLSLSSSREARSPVAGRRCPSFIAAQLSCRSPQADGWAFSSLRDNNRDMLNFKVPRCIAMSRSARPQASRNWRKICHLG